MVSTNVGLTHNKTWGENDYLLLNKEPSTVSRMLWWVTSKYFLRMNKGFKPLKPTIVKQSTPNYLMDILHILHHWMNHKVNSLPPNSPRKELYKNIQTLLNFLRYWLHMGLSLPNLFIVWIAMTWVPCKYVCIAHHSITQLMSCVQLPWL